MDLPLGREQRNKIWLEHIRQYKKYAGSQKKCKRS